MGDMGLRTCRTAPKAFLHNFLKLGLPVPSVTFRNLQINSEGLFLNFFLQNFFQLQEGNITHCRIISIEVMKMNLLTRSVLEDLFKMHVSIIKLSLETEYLEVETALDAIEPNPINIILRIMGLDEKDYDLVFSLLQDVHNEDITVTEAIDKLEQERELVRE